MVDGDGVGVVEQAHGEGCDQIGQQAEKPVRPFGVERPEIGEGIVRRLVPVQQLPGAPDVFVPREVQLPDDGSVHLGVVADKDTGFIRQIFLSHDRRPPVKQVDKEAQDLIQYGLFFLLHEPHSFCAKAPRPGPPGLSGSDARGIVAKRRGKVKGITMNNS